MLLCIEIPFQMLTRPPIKKLYSIALKMQSGRQSVALKQDIDSEIVDNHDMKAYAHLG
jgi:hypothetical protein